MKIFLLIFFSFFYRSDQHGLQGKWKVSDLVNLVHIEDVDFKEFKESCLGNTVLIESTGENYTFLANQICDADWKFKPYDRLKMSPMTLKVLDPENDTLNCKRYPGIEIPYGKVSTNFLNLIQIKANTNKAMSVYGVKATSSEESEFIVFPGGDNRIALYFGSYVMILSRNK